MHMAATTTDLRRIYSNLFAQPDDTGCLHALKGALNGVDRDIPGSRAGADRLLTALNDGTNPRLTFTQLECLRTVLTARAFAPLVPAGELSGEAAADLIQLYKSLFAEPDLAHLRALQQAVFDYDRF